MRMRSAVVLLGLVAGGCASAPPPADPGVICTAIAVSSLNVTVRDASSGALVCDAAVVASQGSTRHELRRTGDCRYAGPEERAGLFDIAATRAGYAAASLTNVRVAADECHVIPVAVTVDLRPAS